MLNAVLINVGKDDNLHATIMQSTILSVSPCLPGKTDSVSRVAHSPDRI